MPTETDNDALLQYAVRLGDDALMLGHRLSEWCSRAPFLEEDLAITNVALDYLGRARMFYSYAAQREGKGRSEDDFAYLRDCRDYQNFLINELPRGDFAYTMARQFLVDAFNIELLAAITQSTDETLAAIAAKSYKESKYHLRRSSNWMLRLGNGTEESHARLQHALQELWPYAHELFEMDALEQRLAAAGIAADLAALKPAWENRLKPLLAEATIACPVGQQAVRGGRQGLHTEHLGHMLSELQFLQRAYPGLKW
ncbi:MAG TPA: phenylacetate-CoA oxygenase subunit PaaI [Armatimonadetes bacterium]|nr:phenylacetate-CoA oxygenase subunit PaaI [Armatimonadota bacterium]